MAFLDTLANFWQQAYAVILSFRIADFLDICLVAFIIYNAVKLVRETRAVQLIKGLVLLGLAYLAISFLNMQASDYLFGKLFSDFIIVLIILFQPELRHVLESVGRSSSTLKTISVFGSRGDEEKTDEDMKRAINEICKACSDMSDKKIGALMVFERKTLLGEVIDTGTLIDAAVSQELVQNIFYPKSPLHDGAAVFRADRVWAAGCILPLTQNNSLGSELGTRHRAALGMSEQGDSVVVVISEETGAISFASGSTLKRDISDGELREKLFNAMLQSDREQSDTHPIRKLFGGKGK